MIDNPYWDIVAPHTTPSGNDYEGPQVASLFTRNNRYGAGSPEWHANLEFWQKRGELTALYSWSVPDPPSVQFVVDHARGKILDPIAGTGYWAYLLEQMGVRVGAYDTIPPTPSSEENRWHRFASVFRTVLRADAVDVVAAMSAVDSSFTLFLSWPPYDTPLAHDTLRAYRGDRLIYIGEGAGGCTGDDGFHQLLEKEWDEVDRHLIAQWGTIHDFIWVYDRIQSAGQT